MEYFIGVLVSLVAQRVKKYAGSNQYLSLVIVAVLSIAGAGVYAFLSETQGLATVTRILVTAGAFHNFIIRRFE